MARQVIRFCALSFAMSVSSSQAGQLGGAASFPAPSGTPATNLFTEINFSGGTGSYIWLGPNVNPVDYPINLWANYASPPIAVIAAVPGVNIGTNYYTGYAQISAFVRGVGLYSFSVTGSGSGVDLMSALYAAPNGASAFHSADNLQNLVMTNDDSQGNFSGSDPYTLFYQNSSSGCVTLSLVMYNWYSAGGAANYSVNGPGQIASSCAALGPDATGTLAALRRLAQNTQIAVVSSQARLVTALGYDTNTFGKYDWSLSFAGRLSDVSLNGAEGGGALIVARRITSNIRIGAFVDTGSAAQSLARAANFTAPISVGGFAVYEASPDLAGFSARFSAAYSNVKISLSRDTISADTEPGFGRTTLAGRAAAVAFAYGLRASETVVVQPYVGLQRFDVSRSAYNEQNSTNVSYPITYTRYGEHLTTAVAGLRWVGQISKFRYFAAAGGESDIRSRFDQFDGSSIITGLSSFAITSPQRPRRTRVVSSVGVGYEIARAQRVSAQVEVQQQPYTNRWSAVSLAKYSIGF